MIQRALSLLTSNKAAKPPIFRLCRAFSSSSWAWKAEPRDEEPEAEESIWAGGGSSLWEKASGDDPPDCSLAVLWAAGGTLSVLVAASAVVMASVVVVVVVAASVVMGRAYFLYIAAQYFPYKLSVPNLPMDGPLAPEHAELVPSHGQQHRTQQAEKPQRQQKHVRPSGDNRRQADFHGQVREGRILW